MFRKKLSHQPTSRVRRWFVFVLVCSGLSLALGPHSLASWAALLKHPAKSSLSSNSEQFRANELQLKHNYETQPARFEVNTGQTDKRARYFVRNAGFTAFYT